MKKITVILVVCMGIGLFSCGKKYERLNYYDPTAQVDRNYTLTFDHIEVVSETETANVNGKLDVVEKAVLNIYLKNEGPDPCLLTVGNFTYVANAASNGFYIPYGYNFDVEMGSSDALGYKVQYISPGETDYIAMSVRTYEYLDPNQDVQLDFDLEDYDGQIHHVDFSVHIE